jgi:hypothetical protein
MRQLTIAAAMAILGLVAAAPDLSAATRHPAGQSANPDRGPLPVSAGCGGATCFRSGAQKIQHVHQKHH